MKEIFDMREMAYAECGAVQGGFVSGAIRLVRDELLVEGFKFLVTTPLPSTPGAVGGGMTFAGSANNFNASSVYAVNGSDKMSDTFTGGAGGFFGGSSGGGGGGSGHFSGDLLLD
jgi:hypothetical protein